MNGLDVSHRIIAEHVMPGSLCIDATAGRGKDTLFLAGLAGHGGHVIAMDIQEDAVRQTRELIASGGYSDCVDVYLDGHENMARYASPESADCIVFNFGWLPGGDHNIFTRKETSIAAMTAGLEILKPGGLMSLTVYCGRNNGYEERDAILDYLRHLDDQKYMCIVMDFINRINDPPFPVVILKEPV